MKMTWNWALLLLLAGAVTLSSCKKDEDEEPTPDPTPSTSSVPTTPVFSNADGALWAVNSITITTMPIVGEVDTEIGIAVGAFANEGNFDDLVNVGTVKVDDQSLTRNTNNSYTLTPGLTNPSGIEYGNIVDWEVTGGGDFGAFTYSSNIAWPTLTPITSGETVSKSAGYTLTVNSVSNADSVLFLVGSVVKTIPGNATSCTFSADELSGLSNGTSVATVAPYASTPQTLGGKTIYVGKEAVRTRTITITN